jgi:predicted ABC-type ATPase
MPKVFIIGGCNGAGKTTASKTILPEILDCREFVNADEIASALSPKNPEAVAIRAGRIMLEKIRHYAEQNIDFAFETTLATKSYVPMLREMKGRGYSTILNYFYLESVELAIERVAIRVRNGGHSIPEETIRRRYYRGIKNLKHLYIPIADSWYLFDNSLDFPTWVAEGGKDLETDVFVSDIWKEIMRG